MARMCLRVHAVHTQRVCGPSRVSMMSAHQVSGGSPSASGSAARPQIEHVARIRPWKLAVTFR